MGKRYLTSVISCLISTSRSIIPGLLVLMLAASPAKAQGPGTALQYDGVDDYTLLPANILSSVTGSFTLEAWVYWTGANNFYPRVFDFGSSQNNWVAMAAANPFANGNAPIFAIQGYVDTLLNGAMDDETVRKRFLEKTSKNTARLVNLVSDLDEISKLERGEQLLYKQNFVIQELILEVFDALSIKTQEKQIHTSIKKGCENPITVFCR